jgi:hypothetical protein
MISNILINPLKAWWQLHLSQIAKSLITAILVIGCSLLLTTPALANIDDDKYDGNVFVLYAGNGSLVPARISLADSLKTKKPSYIVFYIDDSKDCKQYSGVMSQMQAYYGKAASFIPVTPDSLEIGRKYLNTEEGYYYKGVVPQTVIIDGEGKVRLDESGQVPFEKIDDTFREVFNLLPRTESVALKRRSFNEYNSELTK